MTTHSCNPTSFGSTFSLADMKAKLGIPWEMLVKISRPKMYVASVTTFLFAFEASPRMDSWLFWLALLYVTFPFNLFLMGWNDIEDYDIDLRNPRKVSLFGWLILLLQL